MVRSGGGMDVVTGAFGYIGRYIAKRLLETGREVRTITTHPDKPNPFGRGGGGISLQLRRSGAPD